MEGAQIKVFNWTGLDWTPGIVGGQWSWAVFGLGLILLSAVWFARFDPSREGLRAARRKPEEAKEGEPAEPRIKIPRFVLPTLSPLVSKLAQMNPFLGVLFAELRMLLNGRRWWWWAITAGLNIAILSSPLSTTKQYLLPFAWLWPLAIWSEMGNRERTQNTSQMVFSSAAPGAAPASGCLAGRRSGDDGVCHCRGGFFPLKRRLARFGRVGGRSHLCPHPGAGAGRLLLRQPGL